MKFVYCSNCGTKLSVSRKALPKHGTVIEVIPPHECLSIPLEFDQSLNPAPSYVEKQKFVQKLDELEPTPLIGPGMVDRRPHEHLRTEKDIEVPASILKAVRDGEPDGTT